MMMMVSAFNRFVSATRHFFPKHSKFKAQVLRNIPSKANLKVPDFAHTLYLYFCVYFSQQTAVSPLNSNSCQLFMMEKQTVSRVDESS